MQSFLAGITLSFCVASQQPGGLDLNTSVVGFVEFPDGAPAAGAEVRTNLGGLAVTALDGFFSFEVRVPANTRVTVLAERIVGGRDYGGASSPVLPEMDGFTDTGVITLRPKLLEPLFAPQVLYATESDAWHISMGDLDGDADVDLVTANPGSNTVSVLANEGNGSFAPQVSHLTGSFPRSVKAGDLDADGDLDLATANASGGAVSVLLNQGGGTFAEHVRYATAPNPISLATGDLDGDADLDLVTANSYSGNVSVLRNQGHGTFAIPMNHSAGTNLVFVTSVDLDRDGDLDLAAADDWSSLSAWVSVLWNDGSGGFVWDVIWTVGHPTGVESGDLDLDGDPDLVVTGNYPSGNTRGLHFNQGTGTFAFEYFGGISVVGSPSAVAADDFDRDGDLDLAVTDDYYSEVAVFLNKGGGAFPMSPIAFAAGVAPFSVASGDLDGDGDPDLALANFYGANASVLLNRRIP